jgi:hypothetical protein
MSTVALAREETSFSERVVNLLEKSDYRPAVTDEEKEQIYRLRYDAYLREGAITANFGRRLSDRFDDLDNTCIFGVYVDGELASSMRLTVLSPDYPDLPALGVFPDILNSEVEAGRTIIDPTRFVVDYNLSRYYPELPYVTTRIGWMAGEFFGADLILATVRREHQAFYKRVFGHRVVADARDYPTLVKPLSLMTLDYVGQKGRVHRRYPFFRSSYFERRMLFAGPGMPVDWSSEESAGKAVPEAGVEAVRALAG